MFDKIKYYTLIKTNSDLIVQSILKNLNEINLDYQLKMKKFQYCSNFSGTLIIPHSVAIKEEAISSSYGQLNNDIED